MPACSCPIIGNIGNVLYVTAGARRRRAAAHRRAEPVSLSGKALGYLASSCPFLNMTKQFTGNINQLSQQINSVVMAMARARSASSPCIDEKPEADDGYVTLVNAEVRARRHR